MPNPTGDSPTSQQQFASDDLLDETIWDAEPKVEPSDDPSEAEAEVNTSPVAEREPVAPHAADERPRPTPTNDTENEPETFWERVKSPSRELIVWLAIGYGAAMTLLLLAMTAPIVLMFSQVSGLVLALFIGFRLIWITLAVLITVGGVLIRKRHPLGAPCAGLASVLTSFSWFWSLLMTFHPLHIFLPIFATQFVFLYSVPLYIVYWSLKEEEAIDEAAKRDDFYTIRDSLKERMIEENQKEWESK